MEKQKKKNTNKKQEQQDTDNNTPQLTNQKNSKQQNTIHISGLPYVCTQTQLEEMFKPCGQIIEIKMPRYQDSQRSMGYAFITFSKAEEVEEALKKDKDIIGDRYIDVQIAKGEREVNFEQNKEKPPENCKRIFVKNMPYECTEDEFGDWLREQQIQDIDRIRFVYHPFNKHFKGFAYVDFKKHDQVIRALKLCGKQFKGRKLFIDFDLSQAKAGFRIKEYQEGNQKYNKDFVEIQNKKIKKQKKLDEKTTKIKNLSNNKELIKKKIIQKKQEDYEENNDDNDNQIDNEDDE